MYQSEIRRNSVESALPSCEGGFHSFCAVDGKSRLCSVIVLEVRKVPKRIITLRINNAERTKHRRLDALIYRGEYLSPTSD